MSTHEELLNVGSVDGDIAKKIKLGSLLHNSGLRHVRETLSVSSDAATPSKTVLKLEYCEVTGGSAGNGAKVPGVRGGSVAAASAVAPNAGGTALAFKASEVTGASAVADVIYITGDAITDADALTTDYPGKVAP